MINVHYKEDATKIVVTTLRNKKPIVRTTTLKDTGMTIVEVYKEGTKKPVETFVYNSI